MATSSMLINLLLVSASPRLRVSVSPMGRALLVGVLLVSAYALVRYWRSLGGRSGRCRWTLMGLRAIVLLLMSFALSGLEIEYEAEAVARVLLSSSRSGSTEVESVRGAVPDDKVALRVISALKAKGFEVASEGDQAVEHSSADERFVAAAVLTDGAVDSREARREVESMSERAGGAPVYIIADSSRSEGASVALESVVVTGRAMRGVPVPVRCDIHGRGMKGRESLVTVSDDAKVQASARIAWTGDDERQSVTLTLVPKVAGRVNYSAKVEAAGGEEATVLARPFSLYVEEHRLRVLFFESAPTWEAKFIRRALEQSGLFEVDYFAQVSRASTVGISEEAREQKEQGAGATQQDASKSRAAMNDPAAKLHAALQSAAQLNLYDCVIVGATENSLLSSSETARLAAWVEGRGGGLIILGGNSFNGSIAAPGSKLYPLLPVDVSAQSFSTQAETVSQGHPLEAEKTRGNFVLTPTEAGASGALEGYLKAGEDSGIKPATLTGQGLKLGALRPGASILAVAGQPGGTGTSEGGAILIAGRRYGEGRTLLFAPADSWRMRANAGGEEDQAGGPFAALWQGVTLWTGAGARNPVEIFLSDDSPPEGSAVIAEIRARDAASFAPQKIERLSARLQPLTEATGDASSASAQEVAAAEIAFAPDASDPGVWRAHFPAPAQGRYSLEVDYAAGGKKGSVEKYFSAVAPRSQETGTAFDTLRRAARETGGRLITPAEADALAERLSSASSGRETVNRRWEMRAWWPLAFIIPLLLSAEWFARRWWKVD